MLSVFSQQWFKKYNKQITWLARLPFIGEWIFCFKKYGHYVDRQKICEVTPNSVVEDLKLCLTKCVKVKGQWVAYDCTNKLHNRLIKKECKEKLLPTYKQHFFVRNEYALRLQKVFYPIWITFHTWDNLTRFAPQLNLGFDTLTVNPDASPGTDTQDAYIYYYNSGGVGWETVHDAASGTNASNTSQNYLGFEIDSHSVQDKWTIILRSILLFKTSALTSGATISAAVLSVYCHNINNTSTWNCDVDVYTSTPASNTAIAVGDYSQIGTTSQTGSPLVSASQATGQYNDFTFNATGRGNVSKTGISKFALRNANYDVANTAPTWSASKVYTFGCYASDYGSNKPKLVITYTSKTTYTKTTTIRARIKTTPSKLETLKARIKSTQTKKETTKARVKNLGVTKKETLRGRIKQAGVTKKITQKARIKTLANTFKETLKGRIKQGGVTKKETSKGRIKQLSVTKKDTMRGRVKQLAVTKKETLKGRIKQSGVTKKETAMGRIKQSGVTKKDTSRSRIKQGGVTKKIIGKGRIKQAGVSVKETMRSRVKQLANSKLITAKSRLKNTATKTETTKGRIKQSNTGLLRQRARLKNQGTGIITSQGRVKTLHNELIEAQGRILQPGVIETLLSQARIETKDIRGLITSKAKISRTIATLLESRAYIMGPGKVKLTGQARIKISDIDKTIRILAKIKFVQEKLMSAMARVQSTATSKADVKGRVLKTEKGTLQARGKVVKLNQAIIRIKTRVGHLGIAHIFTAKSRVKHAGVSVKETSRAVIRKCQTKKSQARARLQRENTRKETSKARVKKTASRIISSKAKLKKQKRFALFSRAKLVNLRSVLLRSLARIKYAAIKKIGARAMVRGKRIYTPMHSPYDRSTSPYSKKPSPYKYNP